MFKNATNKSGEAYMVNITHYAAGDDANLTLMVEENEVAIYDLFVAKLTKVN